MNSNINPCLKLQIKALKSKQDYKMVKFEGLNVIEIFCLIFIVL